jgi:UDP-N-acetyl-D-galactosamine dehydrogenase
LGYVGLPVAVAFGARYRTIGFDIDGARIKALSEGHDRTGEISEELLAKTPIFFTDRIDDLKSADFYIVAVPTPINDANQPDLTPLRSATQMVSQALKPGDIVVYESTVYPGATEEVCVPILEKGSGLRCGPDFSVGYSPERINPADRTHTFTNILKVVSGQDEKTLEIVADVYGSVVTAGVHRAPSIRVAEAAKVIENIQRDLNIALMNELALIFDRMGIDTGDVLTASGTKWNFIPFRPGLVGGHCIGVDPYYLTYQAERLGYIPQVILAGRRINESVAGFVAQQTVKALIRMGHRVMGSRVTVLGLTFKEDCPDLRNSKVPNIIRALQDYGIQVQVHDPLAGPEEAAHEYGVTLTPWEELEPADAIVVAVAHAAYRGLMPDGIRRLSGPGAVVPVVMDVKGIYDRNVAAASKIHLWRL